MHILIEEVFSSLDNIQTSFLSKIFHLNSVWIHPLWWYFTWYHRANCSLFLSSIHTLSTPCHKSFHQFDLQVLNLASTYFSWPIQQKKKTVQGKNITITIQVLTWVEGEVPFCSLDFELIPWVFLSSPPFQLKNYTTEATSYGMIFITP